MPPYLVYLRFFWYFVSLIVSLWFASGAQNSSLTKFHWKFTQDSEACKVYVTSLEWVKSLRAQNLYDNIFRYGTRVGMKHDIACISEIVVSLHWSNDLASNEPRSLKSIFTERHLSVSKSALKLPIYVAWDKTTCTGREKGWLFMWTQFSRISGNIGTQLSPNERRSLIKNDKAGSLRSVISTLFLPRPRAA